MGRMAETIRAYLAAHREHEAAVQDENRAHGRRVQAEERRRGAWCDLDVAMPRDSAVVLDGCVIMHHANGEIIVAAIIDPEK